MDLRFGDLVLVDDGKLAVVNEIYPALNSVMVYITKTPECENRAGTFNINHVHRLPRAGERILVKDFIDRDYVERTFIRMLDVPSKFKVVCFSEKDRDSNGLECNWVYWKLIDDKESERTIEINTIVKKIENNDPEILGKLAELILASKEKVGE